MKNLLMSLCIGLIVAMPVMAATDYSNPKEAAKAYEKSKISTNTTAQGRQYDAAMADYRRQENVIDALAKADEYQELLVKLGKNAEKMAKVKEAKTVEDAMRNNMKANRLYNEVWSLYLQVRGGQLQEAADVAGAQLPVRSSSILAGAGK